MAAPSKTARPGKSGDLTTALFAAFEPFVHRYTTLERALTAAFELSSVKVGRGARGSQLASQGFVRDGTAGTEIVVDKTALLVGLVAAGLQLRGASSSTAWLVEWLESEGIRPEQLIGGAKSSGPNPRAAFEAGVPIIASNSLRDRILPAASDMARLTIGRDRAEARHILFALLQEPPGSYRPFGDTLSAPGLARLKFWLVDRIVAAPEVGEKVDAWRRLVTQPGPGETVGTLSDAPALVDTLGRQAFAEVLASRIKQVSTDLRSGKFGKDSTFILHMDGPWGSGKSSILNFLKRDLEHSDPPWLVIEFDAWRNQQRKPSWWPLISQVGAAASRLSWFQYPKARWVWLSWKLRMQWAPLVLSGVLMLIFAYFTYQALSGSDATEISKALGDAVNGVLALLALGGLAWTASRNLFFGSRNAAEAFMESSTEPFRRVICLFERLIIAMRRPVAIFIDDIDRCDSAYVIDLLEGIQTLLRSAPVVYVVAGDRKWICSSFEKRYIDFTGEIGMPGRPLGYLFLDKVFQLSTSVPQLSAQRQAQYWRQLLEPGHAGADAEKAERERLEAKAVKSLAGITRHEDIQRAINETEEGSLERETVRAAAAKQITSPEATRAAEHRLQPLAHLLEANPRSMKRLVNAYGLNHARAFLEGRDVAVEALARWTIIELRWPLLADHLALNWPEIADGQLDPSDFPESIRTLLSDPEVHAVIGRDGDKGQLTKETLKPILE